MAKSFMPALLLLGIAARVGAISALAPQRNLLSSRRSTGDDDNSVKLVLNHLPKCGGEFIENTLKKNVENFKLEQEPSSMDEADRNDFVIGMMRNPLDYYISHWAFLSLSDKASPPRNYLKSNYPQVLGTCEEPECALGSTDVQKSAFREFVRTVNNETLGQLSLRFWGSYMGSPPNGNFHNIPVVSDYVNTPALNGQKGMASQTIMEAMGNFTDLQKVPVDCWIRTESLTTDMVNCVWKYEQVPGHGTVNWEEIKKKISEADGAFRNTSPHAPCEDMYDDETLKLVTTADKKLFSAFGYAATCPK